MQVPSLRPSALPLPLPHTALQGPAESGAERAQEPSEEDKSASTCTSSVGETGSELRASERGSLPGRVRLFGWSKTVGLRAGAVGLRGTRPGRGQKLQASWAGAKGARRGTPGRTGVGWG
ncbi:hypothetical protein LEMLEM_LOCUS14879 [Lemmus lemmus]